MFNKKYICLTLLTCIISSLLISCTAKNATQTIGYLNYLYRLHAVGDIHDVPVNEGIRIDWIEGCDDYSSYFDLDNSYLDFQCVGSSYQDFHCVGSIYIVDKDNRVVFEEIGFLCEYNGGQSGEIEFNNIETKRKIKHIYYSIYRTRFQCEYDVNNDGNLVLLTFEFFPASFNNLPSFLSSE